MANIITLDQVNIAQHYLSALINDDYSGLSDDDEIALNDWCSELRFKHGCSIYFALSTNSETDFVTDDVTGLMADCRLVTLYN